jgi:hypothetical protein
MTKNGKKALHNYLYPGIIKMLKLIEDNTILQLSEATASI